MGFAKKRNPELLAPAGSLVCGLAAFDAGADAVYAGLSQFNARERTENFSWDELSKLIAYARSIERKVYVTLNTLIKESELPAVAEILAELVRLQPDAVLVQDLGLVRMIREYFPSLSIHASTQMGIHNSAGVASAEALGIRRVILERQVNLAETREILQNSPVEIEVFVHGSLCCSVSGACLFSSWLGGASGNRGKCMQPCRRRFYSANGNGFFLSTKDLYCLEMIPELRKLGVASFKIEGRLKKPDYVRSVVTAYRMVLDAEKVDDWVIKPARKILSESLGRQWSAGFSDENACRELIESERMGVSGLLIGEVSEIRRNGFVVNLNRRLHIGDRIRIQEDAGADSQALTVSRISIGQQPVEKAFKGQKCLVHCDKRVPPKGLVYKIGEATEAMTKRIERLSLVKHKLDLAVSINREGMAVEVDALPDLNWSCRESFAVAEKQPLDTGKVATEFAVSRLPEIFAGDVTVKVTDNPFLPASRLKALRREFWELVDNHITPEMLNPEGLAGLQNCLAAIQKVPDVPAKEPESTCCLGRMDANAVPVAIKAGNPGDDLSGMDELILPSFCSEPDLALLRSQIAQAYEAGIRRYRITSLYGLEMIKGYKDIIIKSSFPLPVCNSLAARGMQGADFAGIQAWVELEEGEIKALIKHSSLPVEIYQYGRLPLLMTRAKIPVSGEIRDDRGSLYRVIKDPGSGLTCLLPEKVLSLPEIPGTDRFIDYSRAEPGEEPASSFNYEFELK